MPAMIEVGYCDFSMLPRPAREYLRLCGTLFTFDITRSSYKCPLACVRMQRVSGTYRIFYAIAAYAENIKSCRDIATQEQR